VVVKPYTAANHFSAYVYASHFILDELVRLGPSNIGRLAKISGA